MLRKQRYETILAYFSEKMPKVTTELEFGSVFQLLVATVLSAQCTDKRINQVTPELFRRFPDARSMAKGDFEDILQLIRSVSYPNSKARNLLEMSRMLVNDFGGEVPDTMDDLQKLPGVGRKTANVVMAFGFGHQRIAVDTHVFRVSNRIGLADADNVEKTEEQLKKNLPEERWSRAHHLLIFHGRYCCHARKPECERCLLSGLCKYYKEKD